MQQRGQYERQPTAEQLTCFIGCPHDRCCEQHHDDDDCWLRRDIHLHLRADSTDNCSGNRGGHDAAADVRHRSVHDRGHDDEWRPH